MKTGDIYQLGEHRLAIGDSTDKELVDRLFDGNKARLICTDPPYGVDYATKDAQEFRKIKSDWDEINADGLQTDAEYADFTRDWMKPVIEHLESYNAFYIFNADSMFCALRKGIADTGFYYSQMIIWIKNSVVIGRKDYLPQHEVIAYGWYKRHRMERSKSKSVLFHAKPAKNKLHPTQKPVGLIRKLIENSTKLNEIVYDPFLGSGSTLIASDHLKRKCYGVEMSHDYAKTIIARWEKLHRKEGLKAKKIS
jgi:DNA modification methylase